MGKGGGGAIGQNCLESRKKLGGLSPNIPLNYTLARHNAYVQLNFVVLHRNLQLLELTAGLCILVYVLAGILHNALFLMGLCLL